MITACQPAEVETRISVCTPCPEALSCAGAFGIDNKVYVLAGRDSKENLSNRLYCYDCTSDQWEDKGVTPLQKRVYPITVVLDDIVYIGLGFNGGSIYTEENYLRDFWRYTPATDTWERLADYPDRNTNAAVAFGHNGLVYAGFGSHGTYSKDLYVYDPQQDEWLKVEQHERSGFPYRATSAAASTLNGRCFVGTGFRKGSHNDWGEFLPDEGTWRRCATVPGGGRHNTACTANHDGIWLIGGWHYGDPQDSGHLYADILLYSPDADEWQMAGTIPCGEVMNAVAATAGDAVYFGLGETSDEKRLNNFYRIEK